MRKLLLCSLLAFAISSVYAQRPIQSSSDILQEIKKLDVVGNVLYIAAHPDDENTRLIAYLENEELYRTAYLALTRGDGGQNLLGTEKGAAMGVLRTQELLDARRLDGAEQFFSRAVDFGYSKTSKESLEIWDKQKILADVVWTIRKFRPDVIITRFPPDKRAGHGHHIASAILAEEAFKLSADLKAFPEQLKYVETWQAKRILWNVYWWNKEVRDEAIASGGIVKVDVGLYNQELGLSYTEIASDGRSMHKSQGFGTMRTRGSMIDYMKHTDGTAAKDSLFDGINTHWSRIEGGEKISKEVEKILANYDASQPSKSVQELVKLYDLMAPMKDNFYVADKLKDLKRVIKATAGMYTEALADQNSYAPGETIKGKFDLIVRTNTPFKLLSVSPIDSMPNKDKDLPNNEEISLPFSFKAAEKISQPYWLWNNYFGVFEVDNQQLVGLPENPPIKTFDYQMSFPPSNTAITFTQVIDYKWDNRVDGELHRDVIVSPELTTQLSQQVFLASDANNMKVEIILEAHKDNLKGKISLQLPNGWAVSPESIEYDLKKSGQQQAISFEITPPKESSEGHLKVLNNGKKARSITRIEYPHIKPQTIFPMADAKVVKIDLKSKVKNIGYIIGSGDDVAKNLTDVGFNVKSFTADKLSTMDLSQFETIIVGIRAYNINDDMVNGNDILNEYIKNGGTVIVQYNTNRGLLAEKIGPFPFELSKNRVTKEDAKPTFLQKDSPILNTPNKITQKDFDGWVQERGLYFADKWDSHYKSILSWHDPDEKPLDGSIIVADYGKGKFIYTGISFFRQLPAGVPGAYRLLTNLINYGHE